MDVFEAIQTRRSIRKYMEKPVGQKKLAKILEAVRLAPSAMNKQPYNLVVVTDNQTKEKLSSPVIKNGLHLQWLLCVHFPTGHGLEKMEKSTGRQT